MMKKALKYFQRASCTKALFHPTGEEDIFHHSTRMGQAVLPLLRRCKRAAVVNTAIPLTPGNDTKPTRLRNLGL
jgi:hypothetical protein